MAKIIVAPVNGTMRLCPNGETLHSHRPSIVTRSQFVLNVCQMGSHEIIGEAADDADDLEFSLALAKVEGDDKKAEVLESFKVKVPQEKQGKPEPQEKQKESK